MHISFRVSFSLLVFASLLTCGFTPAAHAAGPGGDVFFGYSRLGSNAFYPNVGGLNGWDLDGQLRLRKFLGVEGDVSHYGLGAPATTPRTTAVLFGPRVTMGVPLVRIFVRAMVGGEHSANSGGPVQVSGGAMAVDFGEGVDFHFAPILAWRVAEDYLNAPGSTPGSGSHVRFTTGLDIRF